jgi:acyl-CoA synthetase
MMGEPHTTGSAARWHLRTVPEPLVQRYVAEGFWTDRGLGDFVAEGLQELQDEAFVVHSDVRPWRGTIGEVHRSARAFAGELIARGIGPGDIVVFQLPNWREAAIVFWGAAYAGAVVIPVVHFYGAKELGYIVEVTEPALVVTPDRFGNIDYLVAYSELLGSSASTWAVVGDTPADQLPAGAIPFEQLLAAEPVVGPVPVDPDAPAIVAFTSGTTREPKGVIHSHRTIAFEARQLSELFPREPPSITGAPVGHFIGMLNAFLCSLVLGSAVHIIDVWNPGEVLRLMVEEHLGVSGGSTYFMLSLLDHPDFTEAHLAYMPVAGLGGSPVPVAVTERLARLGIQVYRSYGSTEQPSITGAFIDEPESKRLRTDGHTLQGVEMRLDEEGQILSRGPELFLGYTDPSLTESVFDEEGWYHTGDIGVIDAEGYLTITDRTSDVIIRGGENISAQEVEDLMMELDAVAEVAVVATPDDRLGERAAAILRLREGATAPSIEEVRAHLAERGLAKQKWPEFLYPVVDLPRTPSGKVQKA